MGPFTAELSQREAAEGVLGATRQEEEEDEEQAPGRASAVFQRKESEGEEEGRGQQHERSISSQIDIRPESDT